mmetsp:Transcript_6785/g.18830  ORF Transcript_6785/g.18830 Transcript_6785/m.18830 type:complete len:217 (-) Transcript_6785:80-730(-)
MAPLALLTVNPDDVVVFTKTQMNNPGTSLTLTNVSEGHVAFKVKTTAPKSYVVKPSYGTMKPGEKQEVQIILQLSPDLSVSSDRFLVQATKTSSAEEVPREQWNSFPADSIQSTKLNVQLDETQSEPKTTPPTGSSKGVAVDMPPEAKREFDDLNRRLTTLEKEKQALLNEKRALAEKSESTSSSGRYTALHLMLVVIITILLTVATKSILPSEAL